MDGTPQGIRQVIAPLREMISGLKARMKIEAVVIFGSRARDEHLELTGMTTEELRQCYGLLCWDILEDGFILLEDNSVFSSVKKEDEDFRQTLMLKVMNRDFRQPLMSKVMGQGRFGEEEAWRDQSLK